LFCVFGPVLGADGSLFCRFGSGIRLAGLIDRVIKPRFQQCQPLFNRQNGSLRRI
jgi:hypothetical protein